MDLEPCPFCGSLRIAKPCENDTEINWACECYSCHARGPIIQAIQWDDFQEIIDACLDVWNERGKQ